MPKNKQAQELLSDNEVFNNNNNNQHKVRRLSEQANIIPVYETDISIAPIRLCYTFSSAASGSYRPFLNIFLLTLGLSIRQAGIISATQILASCLCAPCWQLICRYHRKASQILFWILCIMAIILTFPLPWIAKSTENLSMKIARTKNNCSTINNLKSTSSAPYMVDCQDNKTQNSVMFMTMMTTNIANGIFSLSVPSYIDRIAVNIIDPDHTHGLIMLTPYKIFSFMGYGIGALITGLGAQLYNQNYIAMFFVYLSFMILLIITSCFLFEQVKKLPPHIIQKGDVTREIGQLIRSFKTINNLLFLFTVIVTGIVQGSHTGFLFIYMKDLKASTLMMGMSLAMSSLAEIVFFQCRKQLSRNFFGPMGTFCLCLTCFSVECMAISFIRQPWLILPTQILHGLAAYVYWNFTIDQVKKISRRSNPSNWLRFIEFLHNDIGYIVANIIGGIVYESLGGIVFFRSMSYISCVQTFLIALQIVGNFVTNRNKSRTNIDINHIELPILEK